MRVVRRRDSIVAPSVAPFDTLPLNGAC